MFDAIIVGGSSAGLSAALILGRSRRKVLVFDDGQPCNRFSHASHGFLTRDGIAPAQLLEIAREQLLPYTSVQIQPETVLEVTPAADGFSVKTASGSSYTSRKVLLATGLKDVLPAINGIEKFWGTGAFHCPYCDGWEVRDEALVVIGTTTQALHLTMMLWNWTSELTLCTNAEWELSPGEKDLLSRNGVRLVESPISHVEGTDGKIHQVVFINGDVLPCKAVFIQPTTQHRTPFIEALGCAVTEQNRIQVDYLGRTSVTGIYAGGDVASPARSVAIAVAHGAAAAYGINYDLIAEDFL